MQGVLPDFINPAGNKKSRWKPDMKSPA